VAKKIRSLLFSTLYPSGVRPGHGIFVETRLRELLKSGQVETRVVAPVPWFFSTHPRYGEYARMAQIPEREEHHGIDVLHPRYFLPPKVGMSIAPFLMALGAIPAIRKLLREGFDFDLIDAHYYYPDGVAAALLAKWFRKPLLITARGTDVNLISRYFVPRQLIRWAAKRASASITVSNALSEVLANIDADRSKLMVLRNGVDLQRFHPVPQATARQELGWPQGPTLLSVGNLVENKGHDIAIESLAELPDFRLVIVGAGPERQLLENLSIRLDVAHRVLFVGRVAQENLLSYYSAADILILASSREGWPNVLLESMACGTPVVATDVGGIPEVVTTPEAGRMTADRSVAGFYKIISELWSNYPDRAAVRRYAEMFGWEATTAAQVSLFQNISAVQVLPSIEHDSQAGTVTTSAARVESGKSSKHA
jgi:teichuronic acid biosynthesis glycosyltransferase TuaC